LFYTAPLLFLKILNNKMRTKAPIFNTATRIKPDSASGARFGGAALKRPRWPPSPLLLRLPALRRLLIAKSRGLSLWPPIAATASTAAYELCSDRLGLLLSAPRGSLPKPLTSLRGSCLNQAFSSTHQHA